MSPYDVSTAVNAIPEMVIDALGAQSASLTRRAFSESIDPGSYLASYMTAVGHPNPGTWIDVRTANILTTAVKRDGEVILQDCIRLLESRLCHLARKGDLVKRPTSLFMRIVTTRSQHT